MIKALLDADTNNSIVNEENKDCNTALHLAALGSNTEVVKLLIEKGANIDIKNAKGKTFLDLVKDSQVCIPLLELVAKYKPENTKDFLSSEPDLISKLSKENNLGKELKEIVDEVENTQRVSKKEGFLPRLVNSKVIVNPGIEGLTKIIEKSRD